MRFSFGYDKIEKEKTIYGRKERIAPGGECEKGKFMKRLLSLLLCLALGVCGMAAMTPGRAVSAETSKWEIGEMDLSFIHDSTSRKYVGGMIRFHLAGEKDGRVRSALARGKSAVFFFEGASNNLREGSYTDYHKYHFTAVCVVVKMVDGKLQIVFTDDCSSTYPDNPRKPELNEGTDMPTVTDGIYPLVTCNHGDYAALHLKCYDHGGAIRCTRTSSYMDCSYGINVHARYQDVVTPDSASSAGCFLVGRTPAASGQYNAFMKAVTGIENAHSNRFSTVAEDAGVAVVDRTLFTEQIKDLYGKDSTHTTAEIAYMLTSFTQKLGADPFAWDGGHTHSFSEAREEAEHPHRSYRVCSCGEIEYLDAGKKIGDCEECYPTPKLKEFSEFLPITCRIYGLQAVTAYTSASGETENGKVSGTAEYVVLAVYETGICKLQKSGETKPVYVKTEDVFFGYDEYGLNRASAKEDITTYTNPAGGQYGYVGAGDTYYYLGSQGGRTQVLYPIGSGGYKLAWVPDGKVPRKNPEPKKETSTQTGGEETSKEQSAKPSTEQSDAQSSTQSVSEPQGEKKFPIIPIAVLGGALVLAAGIFMILKKKLSHKGENQE